MRTGTGPLRSLLAVGCFVGLAGQAPVANIDPLTAEIELADAERFAALFEETGGTPTAEQLQESYLDPGGRAIEIFTEGRIGDADRLAGKIADNPARYADAIERCLPLVRDTQDDLRSIYLGFRGLLPEKPLPRIAVVFGAGNSGGTAGPGMQVLGLEVLCRIAPDEASFRAIMRQFFAHETVHSFQDIPWDQFESEALLAAVLAEGTADYLAALVTGETPDPARVEWAEANEEFVWREFRNDLDRMKAPGLDEDRARAILKRWVGNASNPPEGWPSELGYWVGMKIAEGYVAKARDPHTAIRELLVFDDPEAIFAQSGVGLPPDEGS